MIIKYAVPKYIVRNVQKSEYLWFSFDEICLSRFILKYDYYIDRWET